MSSSNLNYKPGKFVDLTSRHLFLSVCTRNQYTLGITLLSLSLSLPYRLFIRIWRNTISVLIDQYM